MSVVPSSHNYCSEINSVQQEKTLDVILGSLDNLSVVGRSVAFDLILLA
jgi:hypothetical protein